MTKEKNLPSKNVSQVFGFRPVYASGGVESEISYAGYRYKLHVFTTVGSDSFFVYDSGTDGIVEYLVVAGGGGGGMDMGGGGGGGGVLSGRHIVASNSNMSVTVGAGGFGGPSGSGGYRTDGSGPQPSAHQFTISATNGSNSVFGPYTAIGGGYGGSSYYGYTPNSGAGASGGCGGAPSGYSSGASTYISGAAGTLGQGYAAGRGGPQYYSGGGGGAGGNGVSSTSQPNGGNGILNDILGFDLYWGGGGGGASYSLGTGGNGGIGGGGGGAVGTTTGGAGFNPGYPGYGGSPNAQTNTRGGSGGANTGGGGGGGSHYNATNAGGDGGSGIVIVRYPLERPLPPYVTSGLLLHLDAGNPSSYPGSGSTWYDLSGRGYNATLVNSPTFNSNGYFSLNGTNQTFSVSKPNPNITGPISLETWIYFNNITSNPVFLHKGSHYSTQIIGTNQYYWADSTNYSYSSFGAQTATNIGQTGVWKQVVLTKDTNNDVRLYLNGSLINTRSAFGSGLTAVTSTLWLIGYSDTDTTPSSSMVNGNLSIVRIYNRTLSQTEISLNFNLYRQRFNL